MLPRSSTTIPGLIGRPKLLTGHMSSGWRGMPLEIPIAIDSAVVSFINHAWSPVVALTIVVGTGRSSSIEMKRCDTESTACNHARPWAISIFTTLASMSNPSSVMTCSSVPTCRSLAPATKYPDSEIASTGVIRPLIRAVLGIAASGRGWFEAAFWAVSRVAGN